MSRFVMFASPLLGWYSIVAPPLVTTGRLPRALGAPVRLGQTPLVRSCVLVPGRAARPRAEAARVIVAPEDMLSGFRLTSGVGGFLFLLKGSRKDGEAIAALSEPERI